MAIRITKKAFNLAVREKKERIQDLRNKNLRETATLFEKALCTYYNSVKIIELERDFHFEDHKIFRNKMILKDINIGTNTGKGIIIAKTHNSIILENPYRPNKLNEIFLENFNSIF